jgi:putative transposase
LLREARDRDGLAILAWCVMANHYHLAVRTGPVPLGRTMSFVQSRFGQSHNRRAGTGGPLWQSRYKAKLVEDERYLLQLIAYIHLNPVTARVVRDPARFMASGHRELLGDTPRPLVDVDAVLKLFGKSRQSARRSYLKLVEACRKDKWMKESPGQLPWWGRDVDRPLPAGPSISRLDPLGRSPGPNRPRLDAATFVARACRTLKVKAVLLTDTGKDKQRSEVRYLLGGLAIERWHIRAGELAAVVGRRSEVISRWAARAAALRQTDAAFKRKYEDLDTALAAGQKPTSKP